MPERSLRDTNTWKYENRHVGGVRIKHTCAQRHTIARRQLDRLWIDWSSHKRGKSIGPSFAAMNGERRLVSASPFPHFESCQNTLS